MQQLNKVRFLVEVPTAFLETVKVVGSTLSLGEWSAEFGHLLQTSDLLYPYWASTSEVDLPTEAEIEFKLVVVGQEGSLRWEKGENRRLRVTEPVTLMCYWEKTDIVTEVLQDRKASENQRKKSAELLLSGHQADYEHYFGEMPEQNIGKVLHFSDPQCKQCDMIVGERHRTVIVEGQQKLRGLLERSSLVYVSSWHALEQIARAQLSKVCYLCTEDYLGLSDRAVQLKSIIFSKTKALKSYLGLLAQRNCRVLNIYESKVVLGRQNIQVLLLNSINKLQLNNPEYQINLFYQCSRSILLCEQEAHQRCIYRVFPRHLRTSNLCDVVPVYTQLTEQELQLALRASNKFRHNILVFGGNSPISHNSGPIERTSIIANQGRYVRSDCQKMSERIQKLAADLLKDVRRSLEKLRLEDVLDVIVQDQGYILLTAKSIRLSDAILDCVQAELRKKPQLKALKFHRSAQCLCISRALEATHIQSIMNECMANTVILVGQPNFPQFFQPETLLFCSPSTGHLFQALLQI